MIEHVVHGNQRHGCFVGNRDQPHQPAAVVAAIEHAGRQPDGWRSGGRLQAHQQVRRRRGIDRVGRQHNEVEAFDVLQQIVDVENALGFLAAAFPDGEQAGQPAPGAPVLRIGEDVRRAVGENQPRAGRDLQLDPLVAVGVFLQGGGMRPHDAGNRIAVGNAEAGDAQFDGAFDQLFRMRAAAQEGEIGGDREFGIGRRGCIRGFDTRLLGGSGKRMDVAHANTPCRNQRVGAGPLNAPSR